MGAIRSKAHLTCSLWLWLGIGGTKICLSIFIHSLTSLLLFRFLLRNTASFYLEVWLLGMCVCVLGCVVVWVREP